MWERAAQWIGKNKKQIILAYSVLLVILFSFAVGYVAGRDFTHAPIVITTTCAQ